jgi:hypothetical protein
MNDNSTCVFSHRDRSGYPGARKEGKRGLCHPHQCAHWCTLAEAPDCRQGIFPRSIATCKGPPNSGTKLTKMGALRLVIVAAATAVASSVPDKPNIIFFLTGTGA